MENSLFILAIADIDEDPNQPRTTFDADALAELATTIRERGVKTPISVRPNPDQPERYIINHGARRFRASQLAGCSTILACVDAEYSEEDQLIENVQRENLSPKEIAEFIGKLLARGKKKGEIARIVGKSPAYVTQHVTLLDLPDPVDAIFSAGRCVDVTVINELVRLYKNYPNQTQMWLEDKMQEINRGTLKTFKEFIEETKIAHFSSIKTTDSTPSAPNSSPARLRRPALWGELGGGMVKLLLHKLPDTPGRAWFQAPDGDVFEAPLADAKFERLCEDDT